MTKEELEKENTELKEFKKDCVKLTEDNVVMARQRAEVAKQLTKSKELLERFLNVGDLWELDGNAFLKLQSDVTQFLKDSEVEK